MSDSYDFRRSTGMKLRDGGLIYDDFYVAPPGTYGLPNNTEQRQPDEGWLERARDAFSSFTRPDTRMASIAATFSKLMRF
jgi:hypothetical protein